MKKKIISILAISIILISFMANFSIGVTYINSAGLYSKGGVSGLLRRNGIELYTTIVVYEKDGVEYPAYCMNVDLPGVGENGPYSVSTNGLLTNVGVWRAITNGYPYKSYSELGCDNIEEAFTATKQAVYCMIYDRDVSEYEGIGEAGERTLNALINIVETTRNSNNVKNLADLNISEENNEWKLDEKDNNYIYKIFKVSAYAGFNKYEIKLEGEIPEGTKVVDFNNNEKKEFNSNEKFKIMLPLKNLKKNGNFTINVSSKVNTKPVLYGESGNSSLQDYAITMSKYEDGSGTCKIYYTQNNTKIKIIKKEEKTGTVLEGVKFNLLDENKNVIYSELETNKKGEIEIENLIPGKYYIQEIKTLAGYSLYDKLVEINIDLNEIAAFNMVNEKLGEPIKEVPVTTETTITSKQSEKILPVTGM